jgi:hypothetical protein
VKLPALESGASREDISFCIVPLNPTLKGGACGALAGQRKTEFSCEDVGAIESLLVPWYEIWNV